MYELNRHNVDSCALKYGHTKCSRSVIDDYFKDYIQVGKSHDSKISKYRKYQKKIIIFDTFDLFDIFQKKKISNKLYNNGCNTLMQYLMTISYQSFVPHVKT